MPTESPTARDEAQEKEKEYQADQSNGKEESDPTAARYTGAHGYTQRSGQKDQLKNLHIGGSERSPQGGNTSRPNEQQQGPGFEVEGSYELDQQLRTKDQPLDAKAPSGPATSPNEE